MSAFLDIAELKRMADEHRARKADHGHLLFTVMMFGLWLDNAASAWKGAETQRTNVRPRHTVSEK
jgi:hypothetical protein